MAFVLTTDLETGIFIVDNEDFSLSARWDDEDGVPYELSDAVFEVRPYLRSATVLLRAVLGDGIDAEASEWWANVRIGRDVVHAAFVANNISRRTARYDLVVERAIDGAAKRLMHGPACLERGVAHLG